MVKSAASFQAALTVASEGDKNPANVLPPLRSPWAGLAASLDGPPPVQGGMSLEILALVQLAALALVLC